MPSTAAAPSVPHHAYYPLPEESAFCIVVPGFLSPTECRDLIATSQARGYRLADADYPPSYRNNDRQSTDDAELAARMLDRLGPVAPSTLADPDTGATWGIESVNERFRFCRYLPGQQFNTHQDGVHHRGDGLQSRLTFMVYLTDGDEFNGGDTVFYAAGPGSGGAVGAVGAATIIGRVRPRAGSLILFDHSLWHAGETVTAGVKYLMRSDVMYRRRGDVARAPAQPFQPGHRGYVWSLAALDDGTIASGGRDTSIRLWSRAGQVLRQLNGHRQSVLGLAGLPGNRLASVSRDRSLRLWNLASGESERVAAQRGHAGWVWEVAETAAGMLVSASEDGSVKLWDVATGTCRHTLAGTAPLRCVAVSADECEIIAGDIDGHIAVWRRLGEQWRRVRLVRAHAAAIRRVRPLAPNLLASAGEDNFLRLWRLQDWHLLRESKHDNFVTDVLALGDACLSSSYDGGLKIIQENSRADQ